MAGFSAVDAAVDPGRLVAFLDDSARAESGMKHYVAAAHSLRRPAAPILDVGCGTGHDLQLLAGSGLRAVGVDPGAVMLRAAKARLNDAPISLVRAVGEALPFTAGAFGGCRLERVLMHVDDPAAVLTESVRCVAPGGLVTVFEPDWSRFEVVSDVLPDTAGWISGARHAGVGGQLWRLLEQTGCDVLDRVEELSVWRSLATLEDVAAFPDSVDRAVGRGLLSHRQAQQWIAEQRARDAAGLFLARIPKILIVAQKHR
jgi:SAM-dependent methyltransferase